MGFVAVLLTAVVLGSGGNASAPAAPSVPPPAEEAYRTAIAEGVNEYDAGRFEEARSLFRRAHELSPNARTYRGLGMTAFELRDYVSAVRNLGAALQDNRKPLTPAQRKDVQDLLDRSRMFVDVYRLVVEPPGARVAIDGRAPEFERDGSVLLGFGTHNVEASAPERMPLYQSLEVRGGANKEVRLALEPISQTLLAGAPTATTVAERRSSGPSHTAAAACLWIAAGAAAVSGAAGVYWYEQNRQLDDCRNPASGMRCTTEDALRTQRNVAMIATLGTGAAAVTLGLIGILTWNSGSAAKPPARRSAVDCLPNGYGVVCGGSF